MLSLTTVRSRVNGITVLAAIAPLLYCASIIAFSVNVPVGDDYAMLGFLNEFHAASGIGSKLQLLLSLHNEHRIVITRAIMLLCTTAAGSLDFGVLNIIGNAALLLTLVVIGRMLRLRGDMLKWTLLLLIVLQPQPLKLMFYPMAGIQAYFGLLFAFLYIHYSLEETKVWYFALLFYALSVITTGSGIFLALIGIPLLLYRKSYRRGALHIAVAILILILYSPASSNMPYLFEHPLTVARFALLLLGSVAQLPMVGSPYLQIGFSLLLLGYCAFLICDGACRTSPRVSHESLATLCSLLYLLMIIGLIAIGRASLYHEDLWGASLDGRYRIYAILYVAICCIDIAGRLREQGGIAGRCTVAMVILATLFNLVWFVPSLFTMRFDAARRVQAMKLWRATGDISVLPLWSTPPGEAESALSTAVRTGRYRP